MKMILDSKTGQLGVIVLTLALFFAASCSSGSPDAGQGEMHYNQNSETLEHDSSGESTTAYNNSTTGTTYSTTGSTTNGRTTNGSDDSLKYKHHKDH